MDCAPVRFWEQDLRFFDNLRSCRSAILWSTAAALRIAATSHSYSPWHLETCCVARSAVMPYATTGSSACARSISLWGSS